MNFYFAREHTGSRYEILMWGSFRLFVGPTRSWYCAETVVYIFKLFHRLVGHQPSSFFYSQIGFAGNPTVVITTSRLSCRRLVFT